MASDTTRLESVETKLAFQEDALQQLSDVLVAQQARLDRLEAQLAALREQVRGQEGEGAGVGDEPPPHY